MSKELKRLTKRDKYGNVELIRAKTGQTSRIAEAIAHLAEYEETGFTPQAITAWNTRADGWISVDERLPDVYEFVIVSLKSNNVGLGKMDDKQGWYVTANEYAQHDEVTHWQPLPKAPKGE